VEVLILSQRKFLSKVSNFQESWNFTEPEIGIDFVVYRDLCFPIDVRSVVKECLKPIESQGSNQKSQVSYRPFLRANTVFSLFNEQSIYVHM